MDFADIVENLAERVRRQRDSAQRGEEATKTALVQPFITLLLGYDINDLDEVVPEYTADVGIKKGEKVDYALLKDGKPIILFECKRAGSNLDEADKSQLYRYFGVSGVRFGVLTDGVVYRFFTDLDEPNKMDAKPFLEFNFLDVEEALIPELKKFAKESFELDTILTTAEDLKYTREIRRVLSTEFESPTADFVRFLAPHAYHGRLTENRMAQFTGIVQKACQQFIRERIADRLKSALAAGEQVVPTQATPTAESPGEGPQEQQEEQGVVTTEDEIQAWHFVQAISAERVDPSRVVLRDHVSYAAVLLDNTNRKPLLRLHFHSPTKRIGLFDKGKNEERVAIESLKDIFQLRERILAALDRYESPGAKST